MADYWEAFVGIDVAKLRNTVAIANAGQEGEVRFFGEVNGIRPVKAALPNEACC